MDEKDQMPAEVVEDPFYSEGNVQELKRRLSNIKNGTAKLELHDLIEADD